MGRLYECFRPRFRSSPFSPAAALQYVWPINIGLAIPELVRYWIGGVIFAGAVIAARRLVRSAHAQVGSKRESVEADHGNPRARSVPFTRNPMYLQMVIACVGVAVTLGNVWWILLLAPVCAWALQVLAILPEEKYLERKFGDQYLVYKKRVRRWL